MNNETVATEGRKCYSCHVDMKTARSHRIGCCALNESGVAPDEATAAKGRSAFLIIKAEAKRIGKMPQPREF